MQQFDVLVVGKGNATLCASLAARDQGASVAILEAAPVEESGGNSCFAGGVMRFAYNSVEELKQIAELSDDEAKHADWGSNTQDQFYDDLYRVTSYRTDPELSEALITKSFETMVWLRSQGARFVPNYRQSGIVAGKRRFFGRMPIEASGGGPGLVQSLTDTALKKGVNPGRFSQDRARVQCRGAYSGPVRGRRNGRRLVLFQLPRRYRTGVRFGVRPDRRDWRRHRGVYNFDLARRGYHCQPRSCFIQEVPLVVIDNMKRLGGAWPHAREFAARSHC